MTDNVPAPPVEHLPSPAVATASAPASSALRLEQPGVQRTLDSMYVPFQRTIGWIVTACISLVLFIAVVGLVVSGELPRWLNIVLFPAWTLVGALIGWFSWSWPAVEYRHTSYILDENGIEIRAGVVWRAVMSVPRSRVQHIDVSQGPIERAYGLGRLVIYTAGTDHSRVELGGLSHAVALALRDYLLPQGEADAL